MKNEQKSDYVMNVVEMVHDNKRNSTHTHNNNNKMMNDYNRLHTLQMTEIILFL